jgi:hypothetical protein
MKKTLFITFVILLLLGQTLYAEKPYRVGTTAAEFLAIGYGSAGMAMGDAYTAMVEDISSIYWNPAGLAFVKSGETIFLYQPWIADIKTTFIGAGFNVPSVGHLALGLIHVGYGEMPVTSLAAQEGTGEIFSAADYAVSLTYARLLTNWFSFGASAKYIASNIWHMNASAIAVDLGVIVRTHFFSVTGERADGLRIGMSISNYGSRMKYEGLDLIQTIDILKDENGNFRDVPGQYRLSEWELPLIFRIGAAHDVVKSNNNRVSLEVDALHNNNSAEFVNMGMQYEFKMPGSGAFFLRGGYKGLFLPESQYGLTLGAGFVKYLMGNVGLKIDYSFRDIGILGNTHSYSIGVTF